MPCGNEILHNLFSIVGYFYQQATVNELCEIDLCSPKRSFVQIDVVIENYVSSLHLLLAVTTTNFETFLNSNA